SSRRSSLECNSSHSAGKRKATTGSVRNTLLDSLLMEAAITWELTASLFLSWLDPSTSIFTVAFSVDRKDPKFL
uniref:Uncharacterized protein n=1 Tax=Scophthalmus maximus TaxID=52904 RepID=A0A8D2ZL66_SCOMX